jgi:GH24 family phage-related lysozyme (muramidase)
LIVNEGYAERAYADTQGHLTVGVGFNLDRPDAAAKLQAVGANYSAVRTGQQCLSKDQIEALLQTTMDEAIALAANTYQSLDSFAPGRQIALVDMAFVLGPSRLRQFQLFIAAVRSEHWDTAADELENSAWSEQAPKRVARDAGCITTGNLPAAANQNVKPKVFACGT